ncbi:MAG: hypothetical protein QMD09_07675 [Desulfatibacillaceae bacterium]|nr:hypothetical protein [Desulfatibacillaceae bacterium]
MIRVYGVLRIALPVLGFLLGAVKVFGHPVEVATFERFGVPDWFRVAFGVLQAGFGFIILFEKLQLAGIVGSIGLLVVAAGLMANSGQVLLAIVPCTGIATIMLFAAARKRALEAKSADRKSP